MTDEKGETWSPYGMSKVRSRSYNMHPFLRHAFLAQNCAYYMRNFTVTGRWICSYMDIYN